LTQDVSIAHGIQAQEAEQCHALARKVRLGKGDFWLFDERKITV
jgi:hypothetical protein